MPIPYTVTMYKCKFGCGKYSRSQKFIAGHEVVCWKDPKNRTCKTCKYEVYYSDSGVDIRAIPSRMEPEWYVRECSHPDAHKIDNDLAAAYDASGIDGEQHIRPVINCSLWEQRT